MEKIRLPGLDGPRGTGWLPDRPSHRDLALRSDAVATVLGGSKSRSVRTLASTDESTPKMPAKMDLREFFSPVEDQGQLGSCTANAGAGMVEYYQRRVAGTYIDASRLFLYKVTRQFLQMTGDTGAFLRSTMGALALFGVPPEKYWPYDIDKFEDDPPPFCFAFAQNYQMLTYYRLDPTGSAPPDVLTDIKSHLAAGLPAMFGFTVYATIRKPDAPGDIPFPSQKENVLGGHAIVAAGYDDARKVKNPIDGTVQTGAFLIRNSWGESWGDGGYGWLPYQYVLAGLAEDWWAVTSAEWVDTANFDQ